MRVTRFGEGFLRGLSLVPLNSALFFSARSIGLSFVFLCAAI
jgi:hypothetical protein